MRKIIAIDFDGCLVKSQWPEIGAPRMDVIEAARREQANGAALILWTCRTGEHLTAAVAYCAALGLKFDAINDNIPETVKHYGGSNCRKVVADEYWDDHAVRVPAEKTYSLDEVALLLCEAFGGDCACNLNGNDEWLPMRCQFTESGECPDPPDKLDCWREYIRHKEETENV